MCQLRHSFCASGFRVTRARAPLRYLSLGRTRSTRSCHARAPCRAGFGRSTHVDKAPYRWEITLLRCKIKVRRAICGLQRTAGFCVARARAPLCWLSLGRRREACEHAARASRVALVATNSRTVEGQDPLPFSARHRCDIPAVASTLRSRRLHGKRERTTAQPVSQEEAKHTSLPRARAVPRCLRSPFARWKGTAPAGTFSPSVRDRAMRQLRPPVYAAGFRVARVRKPLRCLSLGRRRSAQAFRVRTLCRAG